MCSIPVKGWPREGAKQRNTEKGRKEAAMSTDIGGRAVLRPAGNVTRSTLRKASKPPLSPIKPPLNSAPKLSPPNSMPSTPQPLAKTPPLKPKSAPSKRSNLKTPSPSPVSLHHHHHQEPPVVAPLDLSDEGPKPAAPAEVFPPEASDSPCHRVDSPVPTSALFSPAVATPSGSAPSPSASSSSSRDPKPTVSESNLSVNRTGSRPDSGKQAPNGSKSSLDARQACGPRTQKLVNPRIVLTKSTSEVFQRSSACSKAKSKPSNKKSLNKLGSLSFDESSLASIIAAKKAAAKQLSEQRKLKISEYGRKQGKPSRVVPEVSSPRTSHLVEQQRCRFISSQSDPIFVDYHDKEWGVPVHDDRMLFELLTLAGFQGELNWTTILHKRDAYRTIFVGFDPAAVSLFSEKHIAFLEADKNLGLPGGKVRGVVNNARKILEVTLEFGSLDEYLWGFVNGQPMINNYRYAKQVPVKISKAEFISKDLVKRGFRFVCPTIMYSFMQASGMTNDHLVQCFRHRECAELCGSFHAVVAGELPNETTQSPACLINHFNFVLEDCADHREDGNACHFEQQEKCLNDSELKEESSQPFIVT